MAHNTTRVLDELTKQERVVLALVAKGWRNMKIAHELCISIRTVENHLSHIFDKLGVSSRTEAALYAVQTGWLATASASVDMSSTAQDTSAQNKYARTVS